MNLRPIYPFVAFLAFFQLVSISVQASSLCEIFYFKPAPFHTLELLGQGDAATIHIETLLPSHKQIVVKKALPGEMNERTLLEEARFSSLIAPFDRDGLFIRYHLDQQRDALISLYEKKFISLEKWFERSHVYLPRSGFDRVSQQLDSALKVLKSAGLVHSYLGIENILIDPMTFEIKIIDFGIMANVGHFAPQRAHLIAEKRGGRFVSRNQEKDLPAKFEDDEFAVNQTLFVLRSRISD